MTAGKHLKSSPRRTNRPEFLRRHRHRTCASQIQGREVMSAFQVEHLGQATEASTVHTLHPHTQSRTGMDLRIRVHHHEERQLKKRLCTHSIHDGEQDKNRLQDPRTPSRSKSERNVQMPPEQTQTMCPLVNQALRRRVNPVEISEIQHKLRRLTHEREATVEQCMCGNEEHS